MLMDIYNSPIFKYDNPGLMFFLMSFGHFTQTVNLNNSFVHIL